MLNKILVVTTVTASLLAALCNQAVADSATVNVSATILTRTCQWVGGPNQNVTFNVVELTKLDAGNTVEQPFTVTLTDCPTSKVVHLIITGDEANGLFVNKAAASAANVGVEIWNNYTMTGHNHNVSQVHNNGSSARISVNANSPYEVELPFIAKLKAAGTASAGDVSVPITMTVVYQ